jgi:hypothetical protein
MSFDVFISYSTKDAIVAKATCAALEAAKIRCWIAPRDITPGSMWGASIVRAINQCRLMVLVFSSNANGSAQVHREVDQAFSKGKAVLPLRIEDVKPTDELAYYLNTVHWLDALTPPLERGLEQLVTTIRALLAATTEHLPPVSEVAPDEAEAARAQEEARAADERRLNAEAERRAEEDTRRNREAEARRIGAEHRQEGEETRRRREQARRQWRPSRRTMVIGAGTVGAGALALGAVFKYESASAGSYVLVRFTSGATAGDIERFLKGYNASLVEGPRSGLYKVRVSDTRLSREELDRVVASMRSDKLVSFVAPIE